MENPVSFKTTVYDQRYQTKKNYWQFRPSSMSFKILELLPPTQEPLRVLEIGCGEGGNAVYHDWMTEHFVEEIKACNSSGIPHQHAHNRIWSRKV